uniref:Uncharacterized protein n=1 Tax=Romanomermis culicivorax TaxID=13658 RepID=A0A915J0Z8_ROMCU
MSRQTEKRNSEVKNPRISVLDIHRQLRIFADCRRFLSNFIGDCPQFGQFRNEKIVEFLSPTVANFNPRNRRQLTILPIADLLLKIGDCRRLLLIKS